MRYGIRSTLGWGLVLATVGLALFALAPVDGQFVLHVLPGMVLLGVGAGIALNPLLLAAMGDVKPEDSGLASGVVNTAFMMGGALGLAVLASLADARTGALREAGASAQMALNGGYQLAFWVAAAGSLGRGGRMRSSGSHRTAFGAARPSSSPCACCRWCTWSWSARCSASALSGPAMCGRLLPRPSSAV